MKSAEELGQFMMSYYQGSGRRGLSEALAYAAREFAMASGSDPMTPYLSLYFFARVARHDPTALPEYEQVLAGKISLYRLVSPASRRFVETVCWLARGDRSLGPAEPLPEHFPVSLDVMDRPTRTLADLDYLWTEFSVTGSREPVLKVLGVLRWPDRIRARLERWLEAPPAGPLGAWRRQRALRRIEGVAGIQCDAEARTILTRGDLDCVCAVGPQSQREHAGRFPQIRAALPFSLSDDDVTYVTTKGAARWSFLSLTLNHPVVREVWRTEMPDDVAETIAGERPRLEAISRESLTQRAVLAGLLMVGFFGLGLAIAASLIAVPYLVWRATGVVAGQLVVVCIGAAVSIVWAMVPRRDRFVPPGPRISAAAQPRLFAELERTAAAAGQAMPIEVYLDPGVNAWVAQRGGVMGFGSRRVMALGLPLLQVLTVSRLRAVLAHEFGHYHGGDTRLGPWLYQTRAAIARTLQALTSSRSVLRGPFIAYGRMFLRVTHAVSRRQELAADALAARVAGSRAVAEGLSDVHGAAAVFDFFVGSEVVPILNAGFRPPIAEGFSRFVRSARATDVIARSVDAQIMLSSPDPYDTHPPLRERLATVSTLPLGDRPTPDPPAVSLLDNLPALEAELIVAATRQPRSRELPLLKWEEVADRVYTPQYEVMCRKHASLLKGVTLDGLPELLPQLAGIGCALAQKTLPGGEARALGAQNVAAAMALSLRTRGWALRTTPGEPVTAHRADGAVLAPISVLQQLITGTLSVEVWRRQCADLGIGGVDLGVFAP